MKGSVTVTDLSNHPAIELATPIPCNADEPFAGLPEFGTPARGTDLPQLRRAIAARAQRAQYFGANLFADPAWDILLQLYSAALMQRKLPVSKLTARSGVPMSTALRWIAALEKEGLIARQEDPFDGRRVYINLSVKGLRRMQTYFEDQDRDTIIL